MAARRRIADDCSKSEIPAYHQCLPSVGCCWLAIWASSKHMKIGSYISHREIRWNLWLIMPLIPELCRAHTATVFQTDAGKNQTVQVNVCPAGAASISKRTSTRGTNTGRKEGERGGEGGRAGGTTTYVNLHAVSQDFPLRRTSPVLQER